MLQQLYFMLRQARSVYRLMHSQASSISVCLSSRVSLCISRTLCHNISQSASSCSICRSKVLGMEITNKHRNVTSLTSSVAGYSTASTELNGEMSTNASIAEDDNNEDTTVCPKESQVCEKSEPQDNMKSEDTAGSDVKQSQASGSLNLQGGQQLSKRAQKRKARAEKHKELIKQRKADRAAQASPEESMTYSFADFEQSSYYFENGLRKVYPYKYQFTTYAKGRWVGRKIYEVLSREFGFPEIDLDKKFSDNRIRVDHSPVGPDYVLKDRDFMTHILHRHENPVTSAPIEILEDTEDILVINKPSSIPCHPCGRYRFNSLLFILAKEMGLYHLRNIYRLDRLTSGVLILGKSPGRTKQLEDQVLGRQVKKEYVCRVIGKFPDGEVTVDQPLDAVSNKLRLRMVSPKGKPSVTKFERLSYNGRTSVVRCRPVTGRTHQIRVHLQFLGYPIMNDNFYNSEAWGPNKGKDGDYGIPIDEVCQRILTSHVASQYDDGENPFFHAKLAEMRKSETPDQAPSKDNDVDGQHLESSFKKNSTSESSNVAVETSFGCSKSDTCGNQVTLDPVSGTNEQSPLSSTPCADVEHATQSSNLTSDHESSCQQNIPTNSVQDKASDHKVESSSSSSENASNQGLSTFDPSKYVIDPSCDICKLTTVDPQEKHLVMFLHALKYSGPGWSYETKMPSWAEADWCEEDKFMLD